MTRNLVVVTVCCVVAACIWGLVHCRQSDTALRPDVQPHQAANAGGGSDSASSGPVRSIRIVLEGEGDPILRGIADVCVRQVQSRCDAKVALTGEAPLRIEFKTQPGIGAEGFRIEDGGRGVVRIIGNDARGVLYGLGKFLRTSRYDQGGFTPGVWRGQSVPIKPVRGTGTVAPPACSKPNFTVNWGGQDAAGESGKGAFTAPAAPREAR